MTPITTTANTILAGYTLLDRLWWHGPSGMGLVCQLYFEWLSSHKTILHFEKDSYQVSFKYLVPPEHLIYGLNYKNLAYI